MFFQKAKRKSQVLEVQQVQNTSDLSPSLAHSVGLSILPSNANTEQRSGTPMNLGFGSVSANSGGCAAVYGSSDDIWGESPPSLSLFPQERPRIIATSNIGKITGESVTFALSLSGTTTEEVEEIIKELQSEFEKMMQVIKNRHPNIFRNDDVFDVYVGDDGGGGDFDDVDDDEKENSSIRGILSGGGDEKKYSQSSDVSRSDPVETPHAFHEGIQTSKNGPSTQYNVSDSSHRKKRGHDQLDVVDGQFLPDSWFVEIVEINQIERPVCDNDVLRKFRFKGLTEQEQSRVHKAINGEDMPEVLIKKFNTTIHRSKMVCLKPGTWLNDEV